MKIYKIIKLENNNEYKFAIVSASYETPFSCLNEISNELSMYNPSKYKILFDLLLNMGNSSDRFIEAFFDGKELSKTSFKTISLNKRSELRKITTNYFKENLYMLDNSVLSSIQKKMLGKGLVI